MNPEVLLIDPGVSPASDGAFGDISAPPILNREQWGCTPQTCPSADPPLYTTVTHLVVHHTDNLNMATDWAAVVRAIWVLHVQGNGWNDIGYNYLIDPMGNLYEGRAGGDGVLGAHFSGVNSGTMGVALLGTYSDLPPPQPMRDILESMLAWQSKKWRLDPTAEKLHAASGLVLNVISGHRDAGISPRASGTTECPGNAAYSFLPDVRQKALAKMLACVSGIGERNRCALNGGTTLPLSITLALANCQSPVAITPAADWVSLEETALKVAANPGARRNTTVDVGGMELTITQSGKDEGPLACPSMRGIVNGADFDSRPVAAGSQVAIFGENFADATTVSVNGKTIPFEFAAATQINLRLPVDVKIGTNHLTVSANGTTGPETNFWVSESIPAIFVVAGQHAIAIDGDKGTLNTPETPIQSGRPVTIYLTGIGTSDAALQTSVRVGGSTAQPSLQVSPTLAGVYQATFTIPAELASGDYPVVFSVHGVDSREAFISVVK